MQPKEMQPTGIFVCCQFTPIQNIKTQSSPTLTAATPTATPSNAYSLIYYSGSL
jgi:hypothetical protein